MNLITKIFLATLIFNLPNVTFAEAAEILAEQKNISAETKKQEVSTAPAVKEFSAEGEYRLGDRDTRETAKTAALADAKRKIIEQVGVYVQSYSEMNKFNLTQDQIKTAAAAMLKIKHEEVHFYEEGTLCRAFIVATIDLNRIMMDDPGNVKKAPTNNNTDILKIAGIEEYKGHYYKIFDEGLNWFQASERCKDMNGHLVTITSKAEQAMIRNMLFMHENTIRKNKNYYWSGGFNVSGKNWEWVTREDFSYANWAEGEPNNDLGNEYILSLYSSGEWNDCPAEGITHIPGMNFFNIKNSGFICEWESYEDIEKLIDKLHTN